MNATAAKPPVAKPAPSPDAIPATKPDAAACAQSLRVEGTLPASQWGVITCSALRSGSNAASEVVRDLLVVTF